MSGAMNELAQGLKDVLNGKITFEELARKQKPEFEEMEIIETAQSGNRRELAIRILRLEKQIRSVSK